MLTPEDKDLLVKKGISEQQIAEQLANCNYEANGCKLFLIYFLDQGSLTFHRNENLKRTSRHD